ncbi:MAG: HNH endonuclease signature motif containing protein [Dermatophilaceae bacterium]
MLDYYEAWRPPRTPVEQRSVLTAAREVLVEIAADASRLTEPEVADLMRLVDQVGAQVGAARVELTVETARRSGRSVRELGAWVCEHAQSLRQGGWSSVARVAAEAVATSRASGLSGEALVEPDPQSPVGIVRGEVRSGRVQPGNAVAVLTEEARLHRRLRPEVVPTVTRALVDLVVEHGPATMKKLRPRLLARYGAHGELDESQERLRSGAYLSTRFVNSAELTAYELVMTPEQAAVLEGAIGPLSRPHPNDETKERDHRPAGQRRVEALTDVCRRSVGLDADSAGADGAAGVSSAVHVTIPLADLQAATGCGEVLASTAAGTVIRAGQLRRICCDAALIPYVLGTAGEVIDQGMAVRLFTKAQRRRLWIRDGGCTYPGCSVPGSWCRAHHVRHWADHDPTDPGNAALLCERHHAVVHTRRLWARVREKPDDGRHVVWDLHDGSYDRALAASDEQQIRDGVVERREAEATTRVLELLRRALGEADERLDAEWYARPMDVVVAQRGTVDAA